MRPSLRSILGSVAAAAVLALAAASAHGAATQVSLGAPISELGAANAGSVPSAGQPWTRAEVSTAVAGWTFASPGKGNIVEAQFYFEVSTGSGDVRVIAADPATRTVTATSAGYAVSSTPGATLTFPTSVPIAAGQVPGLAGTGQFAVRTSNDGGSSSSTLTGTSATPAVGSALSLSTGGSRLLQARYLVALAPAATTAPSISAGSAPIVGTTLTGSDGAWNSSPTGYARQWVRCDATGASCVAIAGATGASYIVAAADSGSTLRFRVTASNAEGGASDPVDSAPTGLVASGIAAAYVSAPIIPAAQFFAPASSPQPKVTICHATSSASNPYVVITVAPEAVITKGHDQHQDRRDIIPPFDYEKAGKTLTYPGLNWDARGKAVFAAGCTTPSSAPVNQLLDPPVQSKVTICHATASASNPYVEITVSSSAISTQGHDQHQDRRDIIPPFSYPGGSFPGLNWDSTGRAIHDAGCREPQPVLNPASQPADSVAICHRVGGPQYVRIVVAAQGAYNGHAKNHGLDIIPPFSFTQGRRTISFPGQNWDAAGQAIFRNGCVPPPSPQPIRPEVTCIAPQADGSFTAYFAYASDDTLARNIGVGAANLVQVDALSSTAVIVSQPSTFLPGQVDVAVTVTGLVQVGSASWTISHAGTTLTATATAASPRCPSPPGNTVTDPANVGVFVACVAPGPNGTYSATFGYQNDDTSILQVPIGPANRVVVSGTDPGAQDRGQPASLAPGRQAAAFTVSGVAKSRTVSWVLDSPAGQRVAMAAYSGPRCAGAPDDSLPLGVTASCVKGNGDGTYDVTFGYANPNGVSVAVPAGPGNAVSTSPGAPGPETRGQPIQFQPGSVARAFTVTRVPVGQAVTWTVAYQGTASVTAGADFATRCTGDIRDPKRDPEPPAVVVDPVLLPLGVYVECVDATRTTYSATFGYVNPNGVVIPVPVGARNTVTGGPDRGQPSQFAPGTHASAFVVRGIPRSRAVSWTLTAPDGRTATATADPSDPNCTTDLPPDTPQIDLIVDPPDGPRDPRDPDSRVLIDNPGPETGGTPEIVIPVPPGSGPLKATSTTPGVRCRAVGTRVRCRSAKDILPGRGIRIAVRGRACSSAGELLGAAVVVQRPGPGTTAGSSSASSRIGGCPSPVTG